MLLSQPPGAHRVALFHSGLDPSLIPEEALRRLSSLSGLSGPKVLDVSYSRVTSLEPATPPTYTYTSLFPKS